MNAIVWSDIFERCRGIVLTARFMVVEGTLQNASGVTHVIVRHLIDLNGIIAPADEVKRSVRDVRDVLTKGRNFR